MSNWKFFWVSFWLPLCFSKQNKPLLQTFGKQEFILLLWHSVLWYSPFWGIVCVETKRGVGGLKNKAGYLFRPFMEFHQADSLAHPWPHRLRDVMCFKHSTCHYYFDLLICSVCSGVCRARVRNTGIFSKWDSNLSIALTKFFIWTIFHNLYIK